LEDEGGDDLKSNIQVGPLRVSYYVLKSSMVRGQKNKSFCFSVRFDGVLEYLILNHLPLRLTAIGCCASESRRRR
jgi:hypothetical protein